MTGNPGKHSLQDRSGISEDGGWEITYTGFILILLCFFIMLSSFASFEESKVTRFVKSFSNAISVLSGGRKFEHGQEALNNSADIVDKKSEIAEFFRQLSALTSNLGLGKDVEISSSKKGIMIRFSDTVMFAVGAADVSQAALPLLKKIASFISSTSYSIRIEGHTDNLPIRNRRFASNWELSTARAVKVLRYFLEIEKISPQRLSAVGFGEFHPLFPNDSPEHRVRNRRVEIIFHKKGQMKLARETEK